MRQRRQQQTDLGYGFGFPAVQLRDLPGIQPRDPVKDILRGLRATRPAAGLIVRDAGAGLRAIESTASKSADSYGKVSLGVFLFGTILKIAANWLDSKNRRHRIKRVIVRRRRHRRYR